jgi:mannose-1-phosphate guanylyltransferase
VSLPAVILVGGEGTRLRPLTARTPKPMLPLVDRPLLAYTFEHLARHAVERVVLSCGYLPTQIREHFGGDAGAGVTLEYVVEDEPLGTGGAIAFAGRELGGTFLALNGDSLRGADLGELVSFHRQRGARATILLTPVPDPTRYGLVRVDGEGRVASFLEKPRPEEIDTDLINAGVYVLEPDVLDLVPDGRAVSIEREVFPRLAEEGSLYGLALGGYWLDVGTPESYLQAHRDVLERNFPTEIGDKLGRDYTYVDPSANVAAGAHLVPPVFVGPGATIADGVRVGSLAVVGAGATVGTGSVVEHAVVGSRSRIGERCTITRALIGEEAELGPGTTVVGLSVVGPGARIGEGNRLDAGLRVAAEADVPPGVLSFG